MTKPGFKISQREDLLPVQGASHLDFDCLFRCFDRY